MSDDNKKTLPLDTTSDFSLPGRFEESNRNFYDLNPIPSKPKSKGIWIFIVAFAIFSSAFFSYYIINQNEIDSQIIQNTTMSPEERLANQYGVGQYGSEHAHAALLVFIEDEPINFGLQKFQLTGKYIHFENHNPYLIHKHATGVPLDMLFASFGMKITSDCIMSNSQNPSSATPTKLCSDQSKSLTVYVNGERYYSDISQYIIQHNDRILISFGDGKSLSEQLIYLDSLKIFDIPKKTPQFSGNDITV